MPVNREEYLKAYGIVPFCKIHQVSTDLSDLPVKEIKGKTVFCPENYPSMGFYKSENGYYGLANLETKEITDPFLKEVIFNPSVFETWVTKYFVVRTDEGYHLADKDGNCYYSAKEPYIICQNVFISFDGHYMYVDGDNKPKKVTKNRDLINNNFWIYSDAKDNNFRITCYAGASGDNIQVISCKGELTKEIIVKKESFSRVKEWFIDGFIIGVDFSFTDYYNSTCMDNKLCMYSNSWQKLPYYSTKFHMAFLDYNVNDNIGWAKDGSGNFYLFNSDSALIPLDNRIKRIQCFKDGIIYRKDDEVIARDSLGNIIEIVKLSLRDAYFAGLYETLEEKEK